MNRKDIQDLIQNRYLDLINQNGNKLPAHLKKEVKEKMEALKLELISLNSKGISMNFTNESIEKYLENLLDFLSVLYQDEGINDSSKSGVESTFIHALTIKNWRSSLK